MSETFSTVTFMNSVNYFNLHVFTCKLQSIGTDYWQKIPKLLINSKSKFNQYLVRLVRWATLEQQLKNKIFIQEMHSMGITSPAFT